MAEMNETPESAEKPEEHPSAASDEAGKELSKDARMWAMFCHLAGLVGLMPIVPIIGSVIAPLIIWQIKKDEFEFVNDHGKEAVNFQISILIYVVFLFLTCVGLFLLPAVCIFDLVFVLIAGIKANNGERYHYPLSIRFIK